MEIKSTLKRNEIFAIISVCTIFSILFLISLYITVLRMEDVYHFSISAFLCLSVIGIAFYDIVYKYHYYLKVKENELILHKFFQKRKIFYSEIKSIALKSVKRRYLKNGHRVYQEILKIKPISGATINLGFDKLNIQQKLLIINTLENKTDLQLKRYYGYF